MTLLWPSRASTWRGMVLLLAVIAAQPDAEELRNPFSDPFIQVTRGIEGCPTPLGPTYTASDLRSEGHQRVERGTTCYREGRCRLPGSYAYDPEIAKNVQLWIRSQPSLASTSLWIVAHRRWVTVEGCITSPEQAAQVEQGIRTIDDVEHVEVLLTTDLRIPPYRTASP